MTTTGESAQRWHEQAGLCAYIPAGQNSADRLPYQTAAASGRQSANHRCFDNAQPGPSGLIIPGFLPKWNRLAAPRINAKDPLVDLSQAIGRVQRPSRDLDADASASDQITIDPVTTGNQRRIWRIEALRIPEMNTRLALQLDSTRDAARCGSRKSDQG